MHQGRSESASSSYLQGAIRRGQTRIPQHTVSTTNPHLLNGVQCRRRLRVRCYIELSAYLKSTNVRVLSFFICCLFVAVVLVSVWYTFSSKSSTEVTLFWFVKFQTLYITLLTTGRSLLISSCYNVVPQLRSQWQAIQRFQFVCFVLFAQ